MGSRTEGGKIRFLVFVKEVGCERSSQLSKTWPKKSFVREEANYQGGEHISYLVRHTSHSASVQFVLH